MRSGIIILWMLGASQAIAAASEYEEVRDLTLSAAGINGLEIEAGGGRLEIGGDSGLDEIVVTATIVVPGREAEKAREVIESDLTLTLEKSGKNAVLRSYFDYRGRGDSPIVHLDVRMPSQLELEVEDGSGSIVIRDVAGDIEVDDGSGSINMERVGGAVVIEDGSGSISVNDVGADLSINDGSGSIKATGVGGSVVVDDGSGSITIQDVQEDLIIVDDAVDRSIFPISGDV
jgi:hypothetical protein